MQGFGVRVCQRLQELPQGAWFPVEFSCGKQQSNFEGPKKKDLCSSKSAVEGIVCKYTLAGNMK